MATQPPPASKRQKIAAEDRKAREIEENAIPAGLGSVRVQFVDQSSGRTTGAPVALPVAQANVKNLERVVNELVQSQKDDLVSSCA